MFLLLKGKSANSALCPQSVFDRIWTKSTDKPAFHLGGLAHLIEMKQALHDFLVGEVRWPAIGCTQVSNQMSNQQL